MLMALVVALAASAADASYVAEIETWRAAREQRLRADGGWLTVSGLDWLKDGPNTFGSAPGSDIKLPASAPARAGVIDFTSGKAILRPAAGAAILAGGKPASDGMVLRADTAEGGPDVLVMGPVSLQVIERGGRYGVRMKDNDAERRRNFPGLTWYPVTPAGRVAARFVPHAKPTTIPIANVLGQEDQLASPGYVTFNWNGTDVRLDPVLESADAKELFFIFKDATSGRDTYPAGRYLYTELPKDGTVVLDLNKAYSPPCAFTPYATCPLPPPQNRLKVRLEVGEKKPAPVH
jgi:uncharacterized protein (DUF1684 family)